MKKILFCIGILLIALSSNAQEEETLISTQTHSVMQGETVMLICKKYLIKPDDIYKLNPDAVHGISANMVLKLPPKSRLAERRTTETKIKAETKIKKGAAFSGLPPK
jgi:hypothetical protein